MQNHTFKTLLFLALICLPPLAWSQQCEDQDGAAAAAIKAQRQAFNQAIIDKDIGAIENVLHEQVLLVTGTDSEVFRGAEAQLAIWSDDFTDPDRVVYTRTPQCVRVSAVAPVALETGNWRGVISTRPNDFAAGSYAAKWRNSVTGWRLESEIFATEACGGVFCPASRPMAE